MSLSQFATGELLQASDLNNVSRQGVINVAGTDERDQIPSPHEGMLVYLTDLNRYDWYNGSAWVSLIRPAVTTLNLASSLASGYSGSLSLRRDSKWVEIIGNVSGMTDGANNILPSGAIPSEHTPVGNVWGMAYFNFSYVAGPVLARSNGSISLGRPSTGTGTTTSISAQFSITYMV